VLYVEGEPAGAFLGRQVPGTTQFQAEDGSVALVEALPDFESTRFIRIVRQANGTAMAPTEGVIGRFTSEALMATASGSAIYVGGPGTQDVRATTAFRARSSSICRAAARSSSSTSTAGASMSLWISGGPPSWPDRGRESDRDPGHDDFRQPFLGRRTDVSQGNESHLTASFSATAVRTLQSSGIFAGWNDTTGNVAGGNRPAEVAGAFVANAGVRTCSRGRYLAD
jgi:hypothetical protein